MTSGGTGGQLTVVVMVERTAIIQNAHGIHCRPAALIIEEAKDYPGEIRLTAPSGETELRSILELVSLGLEQDVKVKIQVSGQDEENFNQILVELFETHFDFPPREKKA